PNIRNNIFTKTSGTVIYEADADSDPSVTYNDFWDTVGNIYFDEGTTAYTTVAGMDAAINECNNNMAVNPLFIGETLVKATWSAEATFNEYAVKTTLTNSAANWTTDSLKGAMVNPDITQPCCFTIVNNTQTQLIVWGDATAIAHIGDTYQLVHVRLQNEPEGFPANSPCIDAGDPRDDYSQEPEDNGDRINQGRYGGTTEAERTSSNVIIEGYIKTQSNYPVYGVTVTFSNGGPAVLTNNNGYYWGKVPFGWSGTVTPTRQGFTFNPSQRSYTNITVSVKDQNFQAITYPERLYVNDDATGTGDGSSWENACTTLAGVALYRVPEIHEIWFAEGRYIGSFTVPNDTRVYGGFAGNEITLDQRNWKLHPTIIDGNGAYHVVLFGGVSNSRLDGFIITGGVGNGPSWDTREGAGIKCWSVNNSCVIANNVILDNYAVYKGAGIFCVGDGNPKILNNIISGNTGCYFQGGAGINCEGSNPEIRGNIILSNSSENSGGAIYLQSGCVPLIINNIFAGNYTGTGIHNRGGGAICCESASPQIINNTFTANTTASNNRGGAISVIGNADPVIRNNIFFKNFRVDIAELSGDADPLVTYNNFYADADGFYRNEDTTNYYDVSTMDSAIAECANNTQNDPLFVGETLNTGIWTAQGIY
ncbi:MAG: right-handed parallel beta-helix repeat-containing protein, partial [Candidatus Sumerlaeia bacterium]|nr:right-handed parallel beta-helix repeat-containing protein [Candidatus Sumerlaeia bacterium]